MLGYFFYLCIKHCRKRLTTSIVAVSAALRAMNYEYVMRRSMNDTGKLGLSFVADANECVFWIDEVKGGVADDTNRLAVNSRILTRGDFIVAVNGVGGDLDKMREELWATDVHLRVQRLAKPVPDLTFTAALASNAGPDDQRQLEEAPTNKPGKEPEQDAEKDAASKGGLFTVKAYDGEGAAGYLKLAQGQVVAVHPDSLDEGDSSVNAFPFYVFGNIFGQPEERGWFPIAVLTSTPE